MGEARPETSGAPASDRSLQVSAGNEFGCLRDLKVIDLGHLVAGPMAAGLMADHGADVIKVERPGTGDSIRRLITHEAKGGASLWWKVTNRNKRAIALDLADDDDKEILFDLVREADVLITNFAPEVLAGVQLGYDVLAEINPGLIMLSVTGFGLTGPYRDRRGFGRTAEAFSGLAYTTGLLDGPPLHAGFPVADCMAALMGAFAVVAAVHERALNADQAGQHIDLGLHETPFRVMDFITVLYDQLGQVTTRQGTSNSYVSPAGTWQSKDGKWASFTGSTQGMVERFFAGIGRPELVTNPKFATNEARLANRDELESTIAQWMADHTMADADAALQRHDVAMSSYMSIEDIFADPHYAARNDIVKVPDEELGVMRMAAAIPFFSRTPGRVVSTGPAIDAHRDDILRDWLGRSENTEGGTT